MKNTIYTLWQWTWGIVQTSIGAIMYIIYSIFKKAPGFNFHGACVVVWESIHSVSLGKFIFISVHTLPPHYEALLAAAVPKAAHTDTTATDLAIPAKEPWDVTVTAQAAFSPADILACAFEKHDYATFLLAHEYGHTIQSLILGPFYLLFVGLPSIVWNRLPYFRNMRYRTGKSYYSAVFERTASLLGKRIISALDDSPAHND